MSSQRRDSEERRHGESEERFETFLCFCVVNKNSEEKGVAHVSGVSTQCAGARGYKGLLGVKICLH